jgi:uncharacterized membrane protein YphA (DoxX/SURF4 family)
MNVVLWVLQGLLAVAFAGAGSMKLFGNKEAIAERMSWVEKFPPASLKALAVAEILGAVGVVLPPVVHIAPILVPIAASCLAVVMVGAVVVHIRFHEPSAVLPPVMLFIAAVVVAWGRFGPYAF